MTQKRSLLCFCLLLTAVATSAQGQTVIDASRRVNWAAAGVTGGIPARATVCSVLNPGATAAQINIAIAACPSGQVVTLNAGTYNLEAGLVIAKDNVTLRGAGPDKTKLVFSSGSSCNGVEGSVCIRGIDGWFPRGPRFTANWTAGYAKGSTALTLSNTIGMAVGTTLVLDQLNDTNTDTGTIWVCTADGVCADEGGGSHGRVNHAQQQIVKVVAIVGDTVTITPPISMPNWRSDRSPFALWGSDIITGSGVEDMSLDHADASGFVFFNAYDSWIKNVRSYRSNRAHVVFWNGAHITVRDSYFEESRNHTSLSYGIESFISSDNLYENNIFHRVTSPLMVNGSCSGCVLAYNYSIDHLYTVSPDFMIPGANPHEGGVEHVLFEGNDQNAFFADNIHGTSHFLTVFRNYYNGWEQGKGSDTNPIQLAAFQRYHNIIGNVLGRSGHHNAYQVNVSGANQDTAIFRLGQGRGTPNDPLAATTLMRWGNYDTVNAASRFEASEVPSGLSQYANPVPANTDLPASFYLSSRPSWWGVMPWPAIGPDVTGGDLPNLGGHAYRIPARLCYENTPKDETGAMISFNAANCYGGGASSPTPPLPPTNLRIVSP